MTEQMIKKGDYQQSGVTYMQDLIKRLQVLQEKIHNILERL